MLYSIGQFAQEIGVSTVTLRNWEKSKKLIPAKVTPGGTRYYSDIQLVEYMGRVSEKDKRVRVGFSWFENMLNNLDCDLDFVDDRLLTPRDKLIQEMVEEINRLNIVKDKLEGLYKDKNIVEDK